MTAPFGDLPLPAELELFGIDFPAGVLTAFRAPAVGHRRGIALLIPGFTGSKEDFRVLLPLIAAEGWDVIAYSQRGQADSAAPSGVENYRLADFANDATVVAGRIAANASEHVHLVGHSLGGLIARAALIQRPDLFADLTMLCSGPGGNPARDRTNADFVAAHGLVALWSRDHAAQQSAADSSGPSASSGPSTASAASAPSAHSAPSGLSADDRFSRDRFAASSVDNYLGGTNILQHTADSTADVAATGLPVLIAHGASDDAWPIADQRAMANRLGARYRIIPNAGHLPNLDNPMFTATLLTDFWTDSDVAATLGTPFEPAPIVLAP